MGGPFSLPMSLLARSMADRPLPALFFCPTLVQTA